MCQHPISTQQNQHNLSQWIIPTLLPSVSHAGLLQHPIYIFIGQLSPSLRSVSGSRAFSNGGNRSHSLIERLSGDYGEVRNKVVLRNHKHKPFSPALLRNITSSAAAAVYRGFLSAAAAAAAYRSSTKALRWTSVSLMEEAGMDRRMIARLELTFHFSLRSLVR